MCCFNLLFGSSLCSVWGVGGLMSEVGFPGAGVSEVGVSEVGFNDVLVVCWASYCVLSSFGVRVRWCSVVNLIVLPAYIFPYRNMNRAISNGVVSQGRTMCFVGQRYRSRG